MATHRRAGFECCNQVASHDEEDKEQGSLLALPLAAEGLAITCCCSPFNTGIQNKGSRPTREISKDLEQLDTLAPGGETNNHNPMRVYSPPHPSAGTQLVMPKIERLSPFGFAPVICT
ncbi:hypothetical protein GOP47_0003347 [Adiantum capillus-veneris]|uniref:Uncharacterized protein n=1 Tax=Adiantum capillus-veneris TaxID=13818 RepID=A0A9D4ZPZ9_ADICA|nr:hypothetical protein GOP47_0003347 [Adiantum capillus-veneris]